MFVSEGSGGSDTEMMDTGGRNSDSESDTDDDSDSQDDSGGERDNTDAGARMTADRHDDREEERDRGEKHTGGLHLLQPLSTNTSSVTPVSFPRTPKITLL